jgi:hypothetical protein
MRRMRPTAVLFILIGAVLLLSLLGAGAGLASFLLLRAGYGFLVWGGVPFLALLLAALVLGAAVWWAAGGPLPGAGRKQEPGGDSSCGGPRGGDDV